MKNTSILIEKDFKEHGLIYLHKKLEELGRVNSEDFVKNLEDRKLEEIKQILNLETGVFQDKDFGGVQYQLFTEKMEKYCQ